MTDRAEPQKKTPDDASEFEREQLLFFLSGDDVAAVLASLNPSLAWLPFLHEKQVVRGENQLSGWIEKNFSSVQAVRDIAANLRFFSSEIANSLEFRLNQLTGELTPLLLKNWRLIIQYLRSIKRGALQNEWFDIEPQLLRGELSAPLLERLADVLRPKLKLDRRLACDQRETEGATRPSDLMSIRYEIDDSVSVSDVLKAWPAGAVEGLDNQLLDYLSKALEAALAEATDAGVEGSDAYSLSDMDVPSVAEHRQNAYHTGFLTITRVIADLWLRLAGKSVVLANQWVDRWLRSEFRLIRRLGLFASANPIVPADVAAHALVDLARGEFFLTGSSVEVWQLIRSRWADFSEDKRRLISERLLEGPPGDWFREGTDVDAMVDRSRFEILGQMERMGFDIGAAGTAALRDIREREPKWILRPEEQTGFHVWHEGSTGPIAGDANKFADVPDEDLVVTARRIAAAADFLEGDHWRLLCQNDPARALRGLTTASASDDWPTEFMEPLLWSDSSSVSVQSRNDIANLLLNWPAESFGNLVNAASFWLNQQAAVLDDTLLWPIWDRIADTTIVSEELASGA